MLQDTTKGAAVSPTDDQHPSRVLQRDQRHVHQHLVVDELVAFCGLRQAVQHEQPSERRVLVHVDLLKRGTFGEELLAFEPVREAGDDLLAVMGHAIMPRRTSATCIDFGAKYFLRISMPASKSMFGPHVNMSTAA